MTEKIRIQCKMLINRVMTPGFCLNMTMLLILLPVLGANWRETIAVTQAQRDPDFREMNTVGPAAP